MVKIQLFHGADATTKHSEPDKGRVWPVHKFFYLDGLVRLILFIIQDMTIGSLQSRCS